MFTGFPTENTPAIQVWEFTRTFPNTPRIALTDDCAPIQFFKTGGGGQIYLYLPSCPIEGKIITIYNASFNSTSATTVYIFCSDVSGAGTTSQIDAIGVGGVLQLCYSKNIITYGPSQGAFATGWFPLNRAPYSAINAYSVNNSYLGAASGQSSVVIGGFGITASALYSACIGGSSNTASATWSGVYSGSSNTASGNSAVVVGGSSNTASNSNAVVIGGNGGTANINGAAVLGGTNCAATGIYGAAIAGNQTVANGSNSCVAGGSQGTSRSITGNFVFPASDVPIQNNSGRQQLATLLLGRETTDATATRLTSNTSAASTTNQVILPNNSAYTFQGTCIAAKTAAGDTSSWKFEGAIKRGANAASTALVAAVTPTVIAQDAGASTWVLAITADTTNGGIAVTVTGQAATTIRWVVKIETTEVTF